MGNSLGVRSVSQMTGLALLSLALLSLALLILALMAVPVRAGGGAVVPRAPLPQGSPWTIGYETRQYLVNEAETKSRRMALKARLDASGIMGSTPKSWTWIPSVRC